MNVQRADIDGRRTPVAYLDGLLAQDERVLIMAHRHILFLLQRTVLYLLGALALWILAIAAVTRLDTGGNWVALAAVVLSLVPLSIGIYRFFAWRFEQYAVTNYRIIQVEGILSKRTFDSALEKVNDVLMTQSLLGRIFGYGNIEIITGSEIGVNNLTGIADPFAFKRGLLEAKMALDGFSGRGAPAPAAGGQDPVRLLAALTELRDSGLITPDEYESRKAQLLQHR